MKASYVSYSLQCFSSQGHGWRSWNRKEFKILLEIPTVPTLYQEIYKGTSSSRPNAGPGIN
jgi:hypothetical protein